MVDTPEYERQAAELERQVATLNSAAEETKRPVHTAVVQVLEEIAQSRHPVPGTWNLHLVAHLWDAGLLEDEDDFFNAAGSLVGHILDNQIPIEAAGRLRDTLLAFYVAMRRSIVAIQEQVEWLRGRTEQVKQQLAELESSQDDDEYNDDEAWRSALTPD